MNTLPFEKRVRVVSALVEGCSIRATGRLCDVNRETVMYLGLSVGEACQRLHDALMTELHSDVIEVDEIWAYIGKKQARVRPDDSPELGDRYTYLALDATRKAILSYVVGKRDSRTCNAFVRDLRGRITNRPQVSSDGFQPYIEAIEAAFGRDVDYGQVVKTYGLLGDVESQRRYSPPRCTGAEKFTIAGSPDWKRISTSYVERQNLTVRMHVRRFTRLTNAFSKRVRNHEAAVALYAAHYNFCRVHETIGRTPAMALRVTGHVWTIAELIEAALSIAPPDPADDQPALFSEAA